MLKNRNIFPTATTPMTRNSNNNNNTNNNTNNNVNRNHNNSYSYSSSSSTSTSTSTSTTIVRTKEVKFRVYQAENWTEKFGELMKFQDENGHCLVPNCHPENPELAQWTKRQRYQYKLKMDGKRSTITGERIRALDETGFVW